jgi:hypothetical protein
MNIFTRERGRDDLPRIFIHVDPNTSVLFDPQLGHHNPSRAFTNAMTSSQVGMKLAQPSLVTTMAPQPLPSRADLGLKAPPEPLLPQHLTPPPLDSAQVWL